jgi:type II secretory pathway pseudopilin PulG
MEKEANDMGVSLVEAAIVFLMIVIILAIALPAISRAVGSYNVRSAADHIAQRLSAARALAMARNTQISISFNKALGLYGYDFTTPGPDGIPDYPGGPDLTTRAPDGIPDTRDPTDPSTFYATESLPSDVSIVYPSGVASITVTFNSRGELPIGAVAQSIVLRSSRTSISAAVNVNLRGEVSVVMQ